ncbi:D-alanyl-D-alanine carboxypeptidase family protein [Amygdalobacter nucleatus]|uniref:D-alanyl-D-alanine carboxypeptidase family protein n=1 Tax=Amygdalobacter nucleatus TaxID=3029274 RepID=UPI0027A07354|nr:hypothetical protein [Amygdalobacter nucleatus]WEG36614.1 hypothetical protein PYS63_05575 [Amygdalobacter nucleatus]
MLNDYTSDCTNLRKAVKHRRKKRKLLYLLILTSCLLLLLIALLLIHALARHGEELAEKIIPSYSFAIEQAEPTKDKQTLALEKLKIESAQAPLNLAGADLQFNSQNILVLDLSDSKILFSKAGLEQAYPASLVKMMTSILAYENIKDLDAPLTMSEDMYHEFYRIDASMAGYLPHEKTSARELLYGLFLASGAECSTQLALTVDPDLNSFVAKMNAKAKEIGMYQTNFTNVTGLHDPKQVTSAYDMAKCLAYIAKYPALREIMLAKSHIAPKTEQHPKGFEYNNLVFKRFELIPNRWEFMWDILGGKTGYTDEAKQTMATLIAYQGKEYVIVTLNASFTKGMKANPLALDIVNIMDELLQKAA